MSDKDILENAIQVAIDGGWYIDGYKKFKYPIIDGVEITFFARKAMKYGACQIYPHYYELIFNHDFAKALWGEEDVCENCGNLWRGRDTHDNSYDCSDSPVQGAWQYYLQQMVIADDPIKYLGENI